MSDYWPDIYHRCADLPLFAPRPPSARGSVTSAAAADSLDGETLNAMQRRVLEMLQATPGGLTDEEMQTRLGMNPSTQRPRRIELARRGLVVTCGTRKTTSGRNADVWKATAASR
jgi:transcription initiation factor IIE alpha subunit